MSFYREIAAGTSEEIEMIRSLPRYPVLVAMAPTIPRELQAEEGYYSDSDPARLSDSGVPTLILVGGESPEFEKAAAEALEAALPDGRIVVLPGEGHIAHRTAPELFARGRAVPGRWVAPESASGAGKHRRGRRIDNGNAVARR